MSRYAVMPITDYSDTCDAIREKKGTSEVIKSGELPEKITEVYEAGKTAEWNATWDALQAYGTRTEYGWFCTGDNFILKDENGITYFDFKPKYDLNITYANAMFRQFNCNSSGSIKDKRIQVDLAQWLEDLGITFDMSKCKNAGIMFYACYGFTRIPFLDLSACSESLANFLAHSSITIIDGIKSSEKTAWVSTTFFAGYKYLEHCIFSGVIAKSLKLSTTNLDYESLLSVLNCLKDLSDTGTTLTLTLGTTLLAKLTDAEKAIATGKGWTLA